MVTKVDLTSFQTAINKLLIDFAEGIKSGIMAMGETIPDLVKRIEALEDEVKINKEMLCNYHANILSKEKEVEELKIKSEKQEKYYEKKIAEIIAENEKSTKENNNIKNCLDIEKNAHFPLNYTKVKSRTENLVLGDSNTKPINTKYLDKHSQTKVYTCYTFKQVMNYLQNVVVEKQPKNVLIHCGCNDIDYYKKDTLKIIGDIEEVIKMARIKFPESRIIFSALSKPLIFQFQS